MALNQSILYKLKMLLIFYRLNVSWRVLCFDVYYFVQEDDQIAKLFLVTGRQ